MNWNSCTYSYPLWNTFLVLLGLSFQLENQLFKVLMVCNSDGRIEVWIVSLSNFFNQVFMLYKGSCNTLRIYTECLAYLLKYILIDYLYKIHGFKKKKRMESETSLIPLSLKIFWKCFCFPIYIFHKSIWGGTRETRWETTSNCNSCLKVKTSCSTKVVVLQSKALPFLQWETTTKKIGLHFLLPW